MTDNPQRKRPFCLWPGKDHAEMVQNMHAALLDVVKDAEAKQREHLEDIEKLENMGKILQPSSNQKDHVNVPEECTNLQIQVGCVAMANARDTNAEESGTPEAASILAVLSPSPVHGWRTSRARMFARDELKAHVQKFTEHLQGFDGHPMAELEAVLHDQETDLLVKLERSMAQAKETCASMKRSREELFDAVTKVCEKRDQLFAEVQGVAHAREGPRLEQELARARGTLAKARGEDKVLVGTVEGLEVSEKHLSRKLTQLRLRESLQDRLIKGSKQQAANTQVELDRMRQQQHALEAGINNLENQLRQAQEESNELDHALELSAPVSMPGWFEPLLCGEDVVR